MARQVDSRRAAEIDDEARPDRQARLLAGIGVLAVLAGLAVLLSPAARHAGFGWFAYAPPPPDHLDSLVVVNGARALGGGLVVLGLALLALGGGLARSGSLAGSARRRLVGLLTVAGLAVLVGLVGFALPRTFVEVGEGTPVTSRPVGRTGVPDFPTLAWTPGQLADVALVVAGLLLALGCAGFTVGRRARRRRTRA